MKTYYGQMTKERLNKTYFVPDSISEMNAFIGMCELAGYGARLGKITDLAQIGVNYFNDGCIGWNPIDNYDYSGDGMTQINWKPHQEEESKDLKTQLAQAMAQLEKCQAKAQKAADKLEQAEKGVQRLIAEIEKDVELIGGISFKIAETRNPDDSGSAEIPEGVDVDDPKTWQAGDIVECVFTKDTDAWTKGVEYEFYALDSEGDPRVSDNTKTSANSDYSRYARFRFVRRP